MGPYENNAINHYPPWHCTVHLPLLVWNRRNIHHHLGTNQLLEHIKYTCALHHHVNGSDIVEEMLGQKSTTDPFWSTSLIARFMGSTWGPSGADRTQMGPMWAHEICYLGSPELYMWLSLFVVRYWWVLPISIRATLCWAPGQYNPHWSV